MLQTKKLPIRNGILNHLQKLQDELNALPTYKQQVLEAKIYWQTKKKSGSQKAAFNRVEKELQKITAGKNGCCAYCEEHVGTSIEHIYPKGLYPSKTFVWDNYLWACQQCNGSNKTAHFQIFESPTSSAILKLVADRKFAIPPNEDTVFINPKKDNPLDYFSLNLDTGILEIISKDKNSRAYKRAAYTLTVLQLNQRKDLVLARQKAYQNYMLLLEQYIFEKNSTGKNCLRLQKEILTQKHPTVWKEMQCQQAIIPILKNLFEQVEEALEWDY